jgi:hypothetical protein
VLGGKVNISPETIFIGGLGILVSVVSWFLKRDIHRFEDAMKAHNAELSKHSEMLSSMSFQIQSALEVGKWIPNFQRFFGEGGGNSRIWRSIEKLEFDIEQSRERSHWLSNKMGILKGSMEVQGMKCGDPAGWAMPEWKSFKDKEPNN